VGQGGLVTVRASGVEEDVVDGLDAWSWVYGRRENTKEESRQ
jgi:hypothetical protein